MSATDVAILGGFGHVGLPFGIALAETGKKVVLIDINPQTYDVIARGQMPFMEEEGEDSLRNVLDKNLFLSLDETSLVGCHFVVVVLGTPLGEHLSPEFNGLVKFFEKLLPLLADDQHVILRSTVYPGTTTRIKRLFEESKLETSVSYCPERVLQGKALQELRRLPQLVGAFDDSSKSDAANLFGDLTQKIIFTTPFEAELAKLFTNSFRYILFAIANQFYQICTDNSVDFYKVYQAAKADYPRLQSWSTAGFTAGPCLIKDTMQLASFSNNNFFLGHAAMLVNEGLPSFIVERLKFHYNLSDKTVAILGMAFKADIDDPRESLSYKLRKLLAIEAKNVLCSDPFVPDPDFTTEEDAIAKSDIVVIGVPHRSYKKLEIDSATKVVVDIWNFLGKGGCF